MKSINRMSESGTCPKALTAARLGYDPIAQTNDNQHALEYYSMLESVAANQMINEGYILEPSGLCPTCQSQGMERYGIHVEIEALLFRLVGHMDRRMILGNGLRIPVEIKSIGRFTFQKMLNSSVFAVYPEYASQMACYLETQQTSGIYWVLNRDTGDNIRLIVNDTNNILNSDNLINYNKFEKIILPVTYQQVTDKLNDIELYSQDNVLPEATIDDHCRWCKFKYLCIKEEPEIVAKEESDQTLVEAAELYKEGLKYKNMSEDALDQAKSVLVRHAQTLKTTEDPAKYRVSGVSMTYRGMTRRELINKKLIPIDILTKATYYGEEYPDYSIRILKEKKDGD